MMWLALFRRDTGYGQSLIEGARYTGSIQPADSYQVRWDARDQRGTTLAVGVYLVRLHYPGGEQTRRLLLLK